MNKTSSAKGKKARRLWRKIALGAFMAFVSFLLLALLSIPISIWERPGDLSSVNRSQPLVVDNINLVDVRTGDIIRNQQVRIAEGLIAEINPAGAAPRDGDRLVDANGAYVTPGLFDMHVHIHDRKYLGMYLAHGVTSVRNMRGLPMHLRWKKELDRGEWLGSNLHTSSPVLDGEKNAHALQQVVTSPKEARKLVRKYKRDGYDLIKAYGYLRSDVFEAIMDEAKLAEIPVAKHGPNPIAGLPLPSNRGLQSLEHVEEIFQGALDFNFDPDRLRKWVRELKELEPVVTPTLAGFHHLTQLSESKESFINALPIQTLNPLYRWINRRFEVKRWLGATEEQIEWNKKEEAYLRQIVKALDDAGVKLLVGSDAGTLYMPPGSSTHTEMALLVLAGMSPPSVIKAATVNAAETLEIDDQYGTIEVGKVADLVVVENNPLENIAALERPIAVIKAGQWISEEDIQKLKDSGENPSNFYVSFGRLLEDLLVRAFHP